jgi:B9 domain-containing protein 2
MAELHIIGSIVGASGFSSPQLTTKFKLIAGDEWTLLEGFAEGQTQVDLPAVRSSMITSSLIFYPDN